MNNENVFFNPGDAIASTHDFKEARRSAQIIKSKKTIKNQLVIAKNKENGMYAIYYANQKIDNKNGVSHEIKEKL